MSKITLIRHGQASFGAENYDLLSDIGRQQAAAVGEYFSKNHIQFDSIIHGQMSRQTETAQIVATTCGFTGPLILDNGANEFDSDRLLQHYLPILASHSKENKRIIDSKTKWFADGKTFETIFRKLIELWQTDSNCPFESWDDFKRRVLASLNGIRLERGANKKIALVTSGGFIGVTLQTIFGFDNRRFMDTNLTINNASISEIKITDLSEEQNPHQHLNATLLGFNNISPLLIKNHKPLITRK